MSPYRSARRWANCARTAALCVVVAGALGGAACTGRGDDQDPVSPEVAASAAATSQLEVAPEPAAVQDAGPRPLVTATVPAGATGDLVFQSDVRGRPKIFRMALATQLVTQLTHGEEARDETPRWSPDGQRILFASNRAYYGPQPAAGEPVFDLFVMDADGGNVRRLTTGRGNERDAAWAPDGQSVVYWSDGESRGDLYRVWLADGRVERLTSNFVGRAIMPTVSPDGRRVAFASQTLRVGAFWNYQVQVLDLSTGTVTPVGTDGGTCWPAWVDNETLVFVQLEPEPSRIQRRRLPNGPVETVAQLDQTWLYYPRLSPDGRWLVVSVSPEHHDGEDWDLAVVPLDGSGPVTRLTAGPGNDRLPDWRPSTPGPVASQPAPGTDMGVVHAAAREVAATTPASGGAVALPGDSIVFQSDRDGRDKLYALDAATGAVRALTEGPAHRDEEPAWSPDGRQIAFHTNRFDAQTFDLAVMRADGRDVRRVTDHVAWDQDPVWMPDGRSLVFTSERTGTGAIYRVWLDDGRTERLSQTPLRAIMPAVSPDGGQVAYAVATAAGFQLFVLDLATGVERQVTRVEGGACRPAWSPDGTRLAYVRMAGDEPSWLEELQVKSGERRRLVDARPLWSYYPQFSADGTLVFAVSPEHHAGEDWDLAMADAAAPGGFRRLTRGAGNDRVPSLR